MSFKDFSAAMGERHAVPTVATSRVVGDIKSLDGLQKITGRGASEGLEAGRFYQHGVKATQEDGWRARFGYEQGPAAAPVAQAQNQAAPAVQGNPNAQGIRQRTAKFAGTAFDFKPGSSA